MFRAARADEAAHLTELALRSKAHWGYDDEFLDACRAELTLRPDELAARRIIVAELAGQVLGFYGVEGTPPDGELGHLWLDPASIGTGIGRRLWEHALRTADAAGFTRLRIEAEPYAEGFYLAMGAERIGETPSGSVPGRVLPLLQVNPARPAGQRA